MGAVFIPAGSAPQYPFLRITVSGKVSARPTDTPAGMSEGLADTFHGVVC